MITAFGEGTRVPDRVAATGGSVRPNQQLVWEDASGKVWLSCNTGEYVKDRHSINGNDDVLERLTEVTQSLTQKDP